MTTTNLNFPPTETDVILAADQEHELAVETTDTPEGPDESDNDFPEEMEAPAEEEGELTEEESEVERDVENLLRAIDASMTAAAEPEATSDDDETSEDEGDDETSDGEEGAEEEE